MLIANPELAFNLVKLTEFPEKQASDHIMQMGNEIQIADGEVTVVMTRRFTPAVSGGSYSITVVANVWGPSCQS